MKIGKNISQESQKTQVEKQSANSSIKTDATKKLARKHQEQTDEAAFMVSVSTRGLTKEEKLQAKSYSPREVRAKAKAFLESGNLPPEQREVLGEILKKREDEEKAALKKRIHG